METLSRDKVRKKH